jgi:hypothetical protein
VQTPDHDAVETCGLDFQRNEIADAALVGAAAVVHDEDIAGAGALQCFQKDVDAAGVPGRHDAAGYPAAGQHGLHGSRRAAYRNLRTNTGVGNVRRSERRETHPHFEMVHQMSSRVYRLPLAARRFSWKA